LPERWPEERIPIWNAWWRLHDIQDGTCATCGAPAYAAMRQEPATLRAIQYRVTTHHLPGEKGLLRPGLIQLPAVLAP